METQLDAQARRNPRPPTNGSDDPTVEYQRNLLPSLELETVGQPVKVLPQVVDGFRRGLSSNQSVEIQTLLRQRLRILALIAFGGFAFFNAFRFLRLDMTPTYVWQIMVPSAVYLGISLVLIATLWNARPYTLRQLRWLEGLFFGITTLYQAWETYATLFLLQGQGWLLEYAQRHPSEMSILARQPSTIWMAVIIAYGTFIPNTGRRCAVVTGLIASTPIAVVAVGGSLSGVPARLLVIFLSELGLWVGVAVAMAIYGSHKITVLREEAMAARKLGQYQLKQRLGKGGMGEVYLAEHVLLKRPCAVKVIRPEQAGDPTTLQRFLREVQATATLTHPNTVQVFDYGQASDGTVFYAMEYLTGLSLEELVRARGPLPPARVIFVLRQLCGALAEAHAIGLIHRDVKPSNVILCSRGGLHDVAKLLDFGLVRMQPTHASGAGLTQAGMIFGTPTYMSPEQAIGGGLDPRSDIYSLGALAYSLLTGQPPFVRDSLVQVLAAHIDEPVTPLSNRCSDIPEDLEAVVLRCLAKDPEERFPDATSVAQALDACRSAGDWTELDAAAWWTTLSTSTTCDGSAVVELS